MELKFWVISECLFEIDLSGLNEQLEMKWAIHQNAEFKWREYQKRQHCLIASSNSRYFRLSQLQICIQVVRLVSNPAHIQVQDGCEGLEFTVHDGRHLNMKRLIEVEFLRLDQNPKGLSVGPSESHPDNAVPEIGLISWATRSSLAPSSGVNRVFDIHQVL